MPTSQPEHARFVWFDRCGKGRNLHVLFRKTVDLDTLPRAAHLSLFADTHYQLFINGHFIEFGPVRFDPRFPLFDTHDLSAHLRKGKNVIAVLVNYFGHKTFKAIPNRGGVIAWGSIEKPNGCTIDLATTEGSWLCLRSKSYLYAPKLSFALNAAERFREAPGEREWTGTSYDDSGWDPCLVLDHQDSWGALAPRSIPFMAGKTVPIDAIRGVYPLDNNEQRYSFTLAAPNRGEIHTGENRSATALKTSVYSPVKQSVAIGTFWSDSWLNGKKLPMGLPSPTRPLRYTQQWDLNEGWNFLCGYIGLYQDGIDHYFAVPPGRGIVFSASACSADPVFLNYSPLFNLKDREGEFPFEPGDATDRSITWNDADGREPGQSPCLESAWDAYGDPVEELTVAGLAGHTFTGDRYPQGFALMLDIGEMHLCFPRLSLSGVAGGVIDVTYSEHLCSDARHLLHGNGYYGGDRIICTSDTLHWHPVHPKGARFLTITVRKTDGTVTLNSLTLRSARYPGEQQGSFACSDPLLTSVWSMCARTLAANREDAYVDCSGRERGMYLRDTIIQYFVSQAVYGDQALMQRCLQLYGQSPDATGKLRAVYPNEGDYTIADFSLNALEGYEAYWLGSGDRERIEKDWPALLHNLAWFNALADEREDLLLDAQWDIHKGIAAHYGGFHGDLKVTPGHLDNSGIHCLFSCTYLTALLSGKNLARVVGDDESDFDRRIAILQKSIPDRFWDSTHNAFSDNQLHKRHSIHANLGALRAGVVDNDRLSLVQLHVKKHLASFFANGYDPSDGVIMSPSFAFYLLDGLYRGGMEALAEQCMRTGWGWALAQGMKTCPEYFSHHDSLCHAWSASPAWYLSRYVLGVSYPWAPDCSKVRIDIRTTVVTSARGEVPHPNGVVRIAWHSENGKRVIDELDLPPGVSIVE